MHELQIASDMMKAVTEAVSNYENVLGVEEVKVRIGRVSFVGEEQLRFCWEAIIEENPILRGSRLTIDHEEVELSCSKCGHVGGMEVKEDPLFHYVLPIFACPKCGGEAELTKGKGVMITNVRLSVNDGEAS
ncbi:MAG: hydrogenase maturation nickel metallochaperone HypA [Thermoplasmatota archaeon]